MLLMHVLGELSEFHTQKLSISYLIYCIENPTICKTSYCLMTIKDAEVSLRSIIDQAGFLPLWRTSSSE